MSLNDHFRIYPLSEYALSIEFGKTIDAAVSERITAFKSVLDSFPFEGYAGSVQAYTTLTVRYDPLATGLSSQLQGRSCFDKVSRYLDSLKGEKAPAGQGTQRLVSIPVCYHQALGPDLEELAALLGLGIDQLIGLHTAPAYRVYMIGFVPGFAYLGGLDKRLESPRKATPRKQVPAGSVGIAGMQTGVYSLETPGGWQLIGRTPVKLFDPSRSEPSLLKAGDEVRFYPITLKEFEQWA